MSFPKVSMVSRENRERLGLRVHETLAFGEVWVWELDYNPALKPGFGVFRFGFWFEFAGIHFAVGRERVWVRS